MLILKKLKITNFAIIENIEIIFSKGFNVITGETGAGKSIIINALNLALGYKADISKIRSGASDSEIEAIFQLTSQLPEKIISLLDENDISVNDNYLIYKRKLFDSGRSSAWINNKPCSINLLKTAGKYIVDMHGQHAHQQLLNTDTHIKYLDNYGDFKTLSNTVKNLYHTIFNMKDKLNNLQFKQKLNNEKRELWQFQFDEITKINPQSNEIDELKKEENLLANAEQYHLIANNVTNMVYEGEETLYNHLQDIINQVQILNKINPEFKEYLESLEQAKYLFQELSTDISNSSNKIEFDPQRLEIINNRLSELNKLQKKYNPDIIEIIKYKDELNEKLNLDGSLEFDIIKVQKELNKLIDSYNVSAKQLSKIRQKFALQFKNEIEHQLSKLGFNDSEFFVQINKLEDSKGLIFIDDKKYFSDEHGFDKVEFYIRTNPGEPLTPLVDTVSGGEVSRIMLALKSIIASGDKIPVLVFDEIDTGISGQIARIVGEEMLNLSNNHQILCITHLPQIASLGNNHLCVKKKIHNNRSLTYIENLSIEERIEELAKLIGGKEITLSGLNQAKELLSNPN